MTPTELARWDVAWPGPHPETGEQFVSVEQFERRQESQTVHFLPPNYPSRQIATAWETAYDEDGYEYEAEIAWRDLTDDEWAAALAAYEKALAEWNRTGGRVRVPGATTITGRFSTASGAWAEGDSDGKRWLWREWSTA